MITRVQHGSGDVIFRHHYYDCVKSKAFSTRDFIVFKPKNIVLHVFVVFENYNTRQIQIWYIFPQRGVHKSSKIRFVSFEFLWIFNDTSFVFGVYFTSFLRLSLFQFLSSDAVFDSLFRCGNSGTKNSIYFSSKEITLLDLKFFEGFIFHIEPSSRLELFLQPRAVIKSSIVDQWSYPSVPLIYSWNWSKPIQWVFISSELESSSLLTQDFLRIANIASALRDGKLINPRIFVLGILAPR